MTGFFRRAMGALLAAIAFSAFTAGAVEKPRQRGGAEAALASPDQPRAEFVPGEVLVGFNPGARGQADEVRNALGATKLKEWPALNAQHWRLPPGLDVARAVQVLSANPNVSYAEPNYLYEAAAFPADPPNDPSRGELWGLHNVGQTGGTLGADIGALSAWAKQLGSASIVVAVIDSGVDYTHPDLAANIWINPGEIPGNGIDDDGNGYVDDLVGWDFVNNDNDPMDDNSHGTHVAGTIGGVGNNGVGVIGVSPVVRLMPLKFLNAGGSGSTDNAVNAVLYAASFKDAGNPIVRISNNSWGGGSKSKTLENAIKNSGALFCAAAGNAGTSTVMYPAGYALANIVAVAATDHNDLLASFSNFGSWVHLAAPGVNTLSTVPGDAYDLKSGTSMATPHVAGALALLRAQFPSWNNTTLKNQLLANVDTKAALSGKVTSGGRLNVAKALGASPLPADSVAPNGVTDFAFASAPTPTSVSLSFTATGDDGATGQAYLYDLRYAYAPVTPDNWSSAIPVLGEPVPQAPGTTESFTVDGLREGNHYYFALRVVDERGNISPLSAVLEKLPATSSWSVELVDSSAGDYNSLAYNSGGQPAIAYNSRGNIKLATRTGSAWAFETVAAGFGGVSLAYNPSGTPAVSWVGNSVSGKPTTVLYFADKPGSAWSKTIVESADVQGDNTSLAHNPAGQPCISYRVLSGANAGLRFAWRQGTTWKSQTVHAKAGARYNSLAFAPGGNPLIAYSDDANADNWLDTVRLAEGVWNGTSYTWAITTLETGVQGYGVFANLAVEPTGSPVVSHQMRLLQRIGGAWFGELVDEGNGWVPFMTVDNSGNIHLAYDAGFLKVATRPADGSATWSFSIADAQTYLWWPGSIRVGPDGQPGASYAGDDNETLARVGLQFAKKNPGL